VTTARHISPDAGVSAPGIVVLQEWCGVDEFIKDVAARPSAAGYRALVPDFYRGKVAVEAAEAEHLMKALDFKDAASQDLRGAALYLKTARELQ
jgi:carboxymethylenebutenolidase